MQLLRKFITRNKKVKNEERRVKNAEESNLKSKS